MSCTRNIMQYIYMYVCYDSLMCICHMKILQTCIFIIDSSQVGYGPMVGAWPLALGPSWKGALPFVELLLRSRAMDDRGGCRFSPQCPLNPPVV